MMWLLCTQYCMCMPGVSIMRLLHHHCNSVTSMVCSYNPLKSRSSLEWCQCHARAACWCVDVCVSVRMRDSHWHPLPSTHSIQVEVAHNASALSQVCISQLLFLLIAIIFHVIKLLLVVVFGLLLQRAVKEIEKLPASYLLAGSSWVLFDPQFMTTCCCASHSSVLTMSPLFPFVASLNTALPAACTCYPSMIWIHAATMRYQDDTAFTFITANASVVLLTDVVSRCLCDSGARIIQVAF
jgi:hypothetical protein